MNKLPSAPASPAAAMPAAPRKPEPHECCGTGCIPCVMDIYEEELFEYEKALRKQAESDQSAAA